MQKPFQIAWLMTTAVISLSLPTLRAAEPDEAPASRISSRVTNAENGDVFLIQEVTINAPVAKVWDAYATSAGWQSWVAPVAEVDLKIGGVIKTNYRAGASLDDEDTNTLHIINYAPQRILTLQAEVSKNWPAILKEREKQLYNVISFQPLGEQKTRLVSYGIGYRDSPELQKLLKFFVPANEHHLRGLIAYIEEGKKID